MSVSFHGFNAQPRSIHIQPGFIIVIVIGVFYVFAVLKSSVI